MYIHTVCDRNVVQGIQFLAVYMICGKIRRFLRMNSSERGIPCQKRLFDRYCSISDKQCETGC